MHSGTDSQRGTVWNGLRRCVLACAGVVLSAAMASACGDAGQPPEGEDIDAEIERIESLKWWDSQ